jgi:malic enzyme
MTSLSGLARIESTSVINRRDLAPVYSPGVAFACEESTREMIVTRITANIRWRALPLPTLGLRAERFRASTAQ